MAGHRPGGGGRVAGPWPSVWAGQIHATPTSGRLDLGLPVHVPTSLDLARHTREHVENKRAARAGNLTAESFPAHFPQLSRQFPEFLFNFCKCPVVCPMISCCISLIPTQFTRFPIVSLLISPKNSRPETNLREHIQLKVRPVAYLEGGDKSNVAAQRALRGTTKVGWTQ